MKGYPDGNIELCYDDDISLEKIMINNIKYFTIPERLLWVVFYSIQKENLWVVMVKLQLLNICEFPISEDLFLRFHTFLTRLISSIYISWFYYITSLKKFFTVPSHQLFLGVFFLAFLCEILF